MLLSAGPSSAAASPPQNVRLVGGATEHANTGPACLALANWQQKAAFSPAPSIYAIASQN